MNDWGREENLLEILIIDFLVIIVQFVRGEDWDQVCLNNEEIMDNRFDHIQRCKSRLNNVLSMIFLFLISMDFDEVIEDHPK